MIAKPIIYFGKELVLTCDAMCWKAWGINNRPQVQLSEDPDDFEYLADDELGEAPTDPGTYEGMDMQGKPTRPTERLNKWCARECERSVKVEPGKEYGLPSFVQRLRNKPQ